MAFVVDASVVAAWFLPDEDGAVADDALARLETQDAFAPDLLSHELRNILLSAERRKRISADDIFAILMRFASLPVTLSSSADHVSIIRLAQKHALSAYDAAYLSLAISHNAPLATQDRKLAAAAKLENVAFV
ncbi:twitching motility protein PilT [Agrobacterium sp. TS43]|jgi:predicted nucleic acid-binding protein|uniref:type II toxin-antitoxin system VapC family toxin n=1 Tax=Agrobacterium TaxID=357 RepID=UPI00049F0FE6|nr:MULTISPECIES: type II toxin-antitoxin system VapC family toxin [Agrobacterium]KDR89701.1 twitching motility protein PilT [Agrobacterium tumefaciens GW4]KVK47387.1 twitching motility protein PilT [Agrobacterium sp. LY4]KVK47930.1 twitching motility protein PilT [Agrobacterium sp. JL28]KVK60703.1 twitching motility protein PilT [Agrobacterium sp. TS45]KVK66021.1 twitching motility protein PilT [Agrobacterium sp. C13]